MAIANIQATFLHDVVKVWDIVTSLENYSWRSDLSRVEILEDGNKFIEYTKNGYSTTFTITVFEPYSRYAFVMENDNMIGHWIGLFSYKNGTTTIDFTEDVTAKKMMMKPFVSMYLKKQQALYLRDLRKILEER